MVNYSAHSSCTHVELQIKAFNLMENRLNGKAFSIITARYIISADKDQTVAIFPFELKKQYKRPLACLQKRIN